MGGAKNKVREAPKGKKAVSLKKTVKTFYFHHRMVFDRFPKDGQGYALGMATEHFVELRHPLDRKPRNNENVGPTQTEGRGKRRCGPRYKVETAKKLLRDCSPMEEEEEAGPRETRRLQEELDAIALARWQIGCDCDQGQCDPDTCRCALQGITCMRFNPTLGQPCTCSSGSCGNLSGRKTFLSKERYRRRVCRFLKAQRKGRRSSLRV